MTVFVFRVFFQKILKGVLLLLLKWIFEFILSHALVLAVGFKNYVIVKKKFIY